MKFKCARFVNVPMINVHIVDCYIYQSMQSTFLPDFIYIFYNFVYMLYLKKI